MRKTILLWCSLLLVTLPVMAQQLPLLQLNKVSLSFSLDEKGTPFYAVQFDKRPVILPSPLGFRLQTDSTLYTNFALLGSDTSSFDQTWQPVWGEVRNIRNHYRQLMVHLQQQAAPYLRLDIEFRVFADGVGFRYVFPRQPGLDYFIVTEELTAFQMAGDHTAFWIPGDYDTHEYLYTTSPISKIDNRPVVAAATDIAVKTAPDPYGVQTPLLLKSRDGLYINLHEAAQSDYPAMQLHTDGARHRFTARLVPDAVGNKAYLHAPAHTPWRTILVSDKAADLLASKTILNLNEPSVIADPSWIHPMKFIGVWWEMQTGMATWNYSDYPDSTDAQGHLIPNGRHGANTAHVKKYIDFAAAHGIQGVLVEGWNKGWEDWFGKWKEDVFDFATPYPDFDPQELTRYAASKGVVLIMHNETSGSATDYERQMDTAFRFMKQLGYPAVKTGYVGRIIPRGEHHDGQWMTQHLVRVAQKAACYQVMVDAHEAVRPTGLHRTYPNWMACESARGNEYNAFSTGSPPEHETILPFTRLMGGPMDYTPGIFKLQGYCPFAPTRTMHTTLAKQLALYVTMYSPLQMAADLPENYAAYPDAFRFIEKVPTDWDDTRILEAEPGDYITIARKAKNSADWYLGAITDEQARQVKIVLDFLPAGNSYTATIYRDAPNANWKTNPEAYLIERQTVDAHTTLTINLAPGGGAAVSFTRD